MISDAAQSLTGLLRDVLDVSRAEAGREEGEASDYDPRRLLTSIAGVLRPSLRGRNLELLVDVDPHVPDALRGDPARVRQIVLNLASNAVKYTEEGVARIDAHVDADKLKITVSDTGRGIAEEDLARLFEPWTRTHTRAWAGTGLGLSIARRLARAMGGDVTVVSTLGEGSAFTLELPLETGQATPEMGFAAAPALVASKVLVAEDDAALRRLIGMQLERLGVTHGAGRARPGRRGRDQPRVLRRRPARPAHAGHGRAGSGGQDPRARRRRCRCSRSPPTRRPRTSSSAAPRAWTATWASRSHCPRCAPSSTVASRPCSTTACWTSSPTTSAGPRSSTRCWPSTTASSRAGSSASRAASTPEELRDAAHALRSPSAGFGIARLASRLRRVEAAARKGTMAPLDCVYDTAAQADRALTTRLRATA